MTIALSYHWRGLEPFEERAMDVSGRKVGSQAHLFRMRACRSSRWPPEQPPWRGSIAAFSAGPALRPMPGAETDAGSLQ
jgi:hypothetical protein